MSGRTEKDIAQYRQERTRTARARIAAGILSATARISKSARTQPNRIAVMA